MKKPKANRMPPENTKVEPPICSCGKVCIHAEACYSRYMDCAEWQTWFAKRWEAVRAITEKVRELRRDRL